MTIPYLIDINSQDREHESIISFIKILPIIYDYFDINILGNPLQSHFLENVSYLKRVEQTPFYNLSPEDCKRYSVLKKITPDLNSFWWYLIEARESKLNNLTSGEIDIIAGKLKFNPNELRICEKSTEYLVGFEVKCAYFENKSDSIKSYKDYLQKKPKKNEIYLKIEELLKIGFDKVGLLDIIVNPVTSGKDNKWFEAGDTAYNSIQKVKPTLAGRVPIGSPAGHWIYSEGPVTGGGVSEKNAPVINKIKCACENISFANANNDIRKNINEIIFGILKDREKKLLEDTSLKPQFPFALIDCRLCDQIHGLDECPINQTI